MNQNSDQPEQRCTAETVPTSDATLLFPGRRVIVLNDCDGAAGQTGTIDEVYPSGRCAVEMDNGNWRNIPGDCLRAIPN